MVLSQQGLEDYYQQRAKEYEGIYHKPERQSDLTQLHSHLQQRLRDKNILEIACGTGYWTQSISNTAASIHAIDLNTSVLQIAKQKNYGNTAVSIEQGNAFDLSDKCNDTIDAVFMGFWWSHIPRQEIDAFLKPLAAQLSANTTVLLLDNRYVQGSSTAISRRDAWGNSFQQRQLNDASQHEVLKNFPDEQQLHESCANYCEQGTYTALQYYWLYEFKLKHLPAS